MKRYIDSGELRSYFLYHLKKVKPFNTDIFNNSHNLPLLKMSPLKCVKYEGKILDPPLK